MARPRRETHFPKPVPRYQTDNCFGCFFLACILAAGCIVAYAYKEGEPRRLTHGFDYRGRLCGVDPEVADKKFLYYCGSQSEEWDGGVPRKLDFRSTTCVSACPETGDQQVPCLMKAHANFKMLNGTTQNNVTFQKTLSVEVVQSVTYQKSYPTREYRGKYCVPVWQDNSSLFEQVVTGPLQHSHRWGIAAGSFRRAWPVVLTSAVLAAILGLVYLRVMQHYAGLLIFTSLIACTVLFVVLGLFFLIGLFVNPWNEDGHYQQTNPLFRSFYGLEATAWTAVVGLLFWAAAACMGFTTYQALEKIDESIGLISATCDCIFSSKRGGCSMLSKPIIEGAVLLAFAACAVLGYMLCCSVGFIDDYGIHINNDPIRSLQRSFKFHWWWRPCLLFYVLVALWVLEFIIALGHWVVSYAVAWWYFIEIVEVNNSEESSKLVQDAYEGNLRRVDKVRVHGIDYVAGGERAGFVKEEGVGGDKFLVVPIGRRGPQNRDFIYNRGKIDKKEMKCCDIIHGCTAGLLFHAGSLALGSIVITVVRPIRWFTHMVKSILGKADAEPTYEDDDKSIGNVISAGCHLMVGLLNNFFGGYSKLAYVEMVLSSSPFFKAAHECVDFLTEAGGVVTFLHGSTAIYEMAGVLCISGICGTTAFLILQVPCFQDPQNAWFVHNPWEMTVLSTGISSFIAFSYMSLFNITADALLYVFAWSRKHHAKDIHKYCPYSLKELVGEELDDQTEDAHLKARARKSIHSLSKAANDYAGTLKPSMRGHQAEQRPLLPTGSVY